MVAGFSRGTSKKIMNDERFQWHQARSLKYAVVARRNPLAGTESRPRIAGKKAVRKHQRTCATQENGSLQLKLRKAHGRVRKIPLQIKQWNLVFPLGVGSGKGEADAAVFFQEISPWWQERRSPGRGSPSLSGI